MSANFSALSGIVVRWGRSWCQLQTSSQIGPEFATAYCAAVDWLLSAASPPLHPLRQSAEVSESPLIGHPGVVGPAPDTAVDMTPCRCQFMFIKLGRSLSSHRTSSDLAGYCRDVLWLTSGSPRLGNLMMMCLLPKIDQRKHFYVISIFYLYRWFTDKCCVECKFFGSDHDS